MEGYSVTIKETSKDLTAKERVKIKDTTNAISLDEATQGVDELRINYDYHVILNVHNEKSDNKDYTKIVVIDKNGNKYVTGSESFMRALIEIAKEMSECGETDFEISVYRKDSKNYKGKQFLTCSIV